MSTMQSSQQRHGPVLCGVRHAAGLVRYGDAAAGPACRRHNVPWRQRRDVCIVDDAGDGVAVCSSGVAAGVCGDRAEDADRVASRPLLQRPGHVRGDAYRRVGVFVEPVRGRSGHRVFAHLV